MLIINKEDKEYLKTKIENFESMIDNDDLDEILNQLDNLMTYEGYDINDDITEHGLFLERIYDRIFLEN